MNRPVRRTGILRLALCSAGATGLLNAATDPVGHSPVPLGAGARALGMGGAFAAIADDASASSWNPAGMTRLEAPEVGLSGSWIQDGTSAADSDDWDLDHASAVLPVFVLGRQQSIGLVWQRQFDLDSGIRREIDDLVSSTDPDTGNTTTIDAQGNERYRRTGDFASLAISYGIELLPRWSFGISLARWDDELTGASGYEADNRIEKHTVLSIESPIFTLTSSSDSVQDSIWRSTVDDGTSVVLGTLLRAHPQWTLGLVWKPAFTLHLDQTFTDRLRSSSTTQINDLPPGEPTVTEQEERSTGSLELRYPTRIVAATAWHPDDRRTWSCDITWIDWSDYAITDASGERSPISRHLHPEAFDPGWSVRAGYEHIRIHARMVSVWRAGALYEQVAAITPVDDPAAPETTSATNDDYYGLTAGASLVLRRLQVDAGAQYRWGEDVGTNRIVDLTRTTDHATWTVRAGITWLF